MDCTINEDKFVTLKIKPEISSVVGNVESTSRNVIPIVGTSTAESTLMVKDRTTILLGGLRSDNTVGTTRQVPFLSKLPIIGPMMNTNIVENEHAELLILITPHILTGAEVVATGDFKEMEDEGIK